MLGNLNSDEREFIGEILGRTGLFEKISSGGVGGLRRTAYQFALLFSLVTSKPHPRYLHQSPKPRQRGKKLGGVKNPIFDNLVYDLLISTTTAGGKLTLEKSYPPFGTLIHAIETLAPHLPDGIVPKPLSASTLQRIKTRYKQVKVALRDLEADLEASSQ
jgi:hypothetical protein